MSELFGEVIVINWNFLQIVVISQVENNCIENIINSKVNLKNHGHCRSYLSFKEIWSFIFLILNFCIRIDRRSFY